MLMLFPDICSELAHALFSAGEQLLHSFSVDGVILPMVVAGSNDFTQMLIALSDSYPGIIDMLRMISIVVALILVFKALYGLKQYGELRTMMPANTDLRGPLIQLAIAGALFYLPTTLEIMTTTIFGTTSPLSYRPPQDDWGLTVSTVLDLVAVIGLLAFLRGLIGMVKLGGNGGAQPGVLGKSLTHIIGGVCLIHSGALIGIIGNTFGFSWV